MPSGRPTASPHAAISVLGQWAAKFLQNGAFANFIALYLSSDGSWFSPHPSLITSIAGLLIPFIILKFSFMRFCPAYFNQTRKAFPRIIATIFLSVEINRAGAGSVFHNFGNFIKKSFTRQKNVRICIAS